MFRHPSLCQSERRVRKELFGLFEWGGAPVLQSSLWGQLAAAQQTRLRRLELLATRAVFSAISSRWEGGESRFVGVFASTASSRSAAHTPSCWHDGNARRSGRGWRGVGRVRKHSYKAFDLVWSRGCVDGCLSQWRSQGGGDNRAFALPPWAFGKL